jgi:hypothetical protein
LVRRQGKRIAPALSTRCAKRMRASGAEDVGRDGRGPVEIIYYN